MPANLENSAETTGLEKVSFHSIPRKGNVKECLNYCTIALISRASKVMLKKFSKLGFNSTCPDVQAGFRKGRGTRDQIANICWIIEKAREFQKTKQNKTSISSLLPMPKPFTVWNTTNRGTF